MPGSFLLPLSPGEGWGEGVLAAERGAADSAGTRSCSSTGSVSKPPHPDPLPEGERAGSHGLLGRIGEAHFRSAWLLRRPVNNQEA